MKHQRQQLFKRVAGVLDLHDLRCYWIFVVLVFASVFVVKVNTPELLVPVFGSLFVAGFALHQVKYSWTSFVTVFVIGHVISYPVGTIIVMTLTSPWAAIEPELWVTTSESLFGMIVGLLGVIAGVFGRGLIANERGSKVVLEDRRTATPVAFNMGLNALVVPVVIIYIYNGIYFHKDATMTEEYNTQRGESLGVLGYLVYLSYAGAILQMRRYLSTRKTFDLAYALFAVAIAVGAMLPSGSRAYSMIVLVIIVLYYMQVETRRIAKYFVFAATIVIFIILTSSIEQYRIAAGGGGQISFEQRVGLVGQSLVPGATLNDPNENDEIDRIRLGRRFSDLHAVGFLMSTIPSMSPHIGFEGLPYAFYFLIPTLLRPNANIDFQPETVRLAARYKFRPDIGGSSPMMIIGELYERFGWVGIFAGMGVIGFLLRTLDLWMNIASTRGAILWSLFFHGVVNMHTYTITKIFILMTRQLAVFVCMTFIVLLFVDDRLKPTISGGKHLDVIGRQRRGRRGDSLGASR